ncbi:sensor histidine kinase [Streptomyces iconiensis]|uniref:histidine kinase n=1 Tax=Streptomyces iconiensis TaxID=1384038 RepID=A0ABT6ZTV9_9ACTN|nr:nitrate- and nitrite sensing domain-containing protein [Streptomyces iconiensis]MDJ1132505.1 nitrate- and nitrite sensing domain-containing protein [Streptomyces iconiensis]
MRRTKAGSAPQARGESRGNFTPPQSRAAAQSGPYAGQPQGAGGGGSRMSVRNWRVPTRLNAILLIPVLVALVFGGFKVESDFATWQEAREAQRTAELVEAAADYGNALIDERDRTAEPLLKGKKDDPEVESTRHATDEAARHFKQAVSDMPDNPGLKRRLAAFQKVEPRLGVLRESAYTKGMDGVKTEEGYVTIQHPLMEFSNELGLGTGNVTSYGRTVYAISLAKAAESLQRALGAHLMIKPGPSAKSKEQQLTALASYHYLERIALGEYSSGGRPQDVDLLKSELGKAKAEGRKKVAAAKEEATAAGQPFVAPPSMDKMVELIGGGAGPRKLRSEGITTESWAATSTGTFDAYRAIEKKLTRHAVEETEQIAADALRDAIINSAVVLVALLFAFVIAGRMARSMSRSMRTLRTAAFDVAEQRLPMLVDQLSRTEPGRVDTRVQPIPITSRDEIGEVARAFDQVHREAVRLAAEQALLRGNVNAIFTNLSRRNQGLIERQLTLVTDMENNEADPDQLESLFRMDHLATRMRRNGENLLVLAGEEPGRRWTEPVPLIDILRAASSEVEHYERIEVTGVPETEIHGQVVNDLVHLLAELLENATSFSSPQTKVRVNATRLPDGRLMIEIHDKGIGLTAEDFADINHKLANPPTVDAAVSQRMGLFVVGRLADRHGIRVQLRPSGEQAGTTSLVMLPDAITHGGGGEEGAPEDYEDFTVSRIVPEQPRVQAVYDNTSPSAADLGFDDTRYGPQDELSALGPVGRSRLREERRAALESQQQAEQPQLPGGQGQQQPQQYQQPYDTSYDPSYGATYDPSYGQGHAPQSPEQGYGQQPAPGQEYGRPSHDPAHARPYDAYPQQYDQGAPESAPEFGQPQQAAYEGQYSSSQLEAESAPGVHEGEGDRVGFDRPGPLPSSFRSTTGAGLPRREPVRSPLDGGQGAQHQAHPEGLGNPPESLQEQSSQEETGTYRRTSNDELWDKAGQLRDPQAGGVTSSGLPRRVPRANLVEGAAEESPHSGASVSRAPEDVRGRLSNLHRGVRRGRTAGDANQNDRQGFGPGSTYDQER